MEPAHHRKRTDEDNAFGYHVDNVVGKTCLHCGNVVRDVTHDGTCLAFFKIRDGQFLQFTIDGVTHVDDDFLCDIRHQVMLTVEEYAAQEECYYDTDRDEVEHHHILVGKDLVDDAFDEPRHVEVGSCREHRAHHRHNESSRIRSDI